MDSMPFSRLARLIRTKSAERLYGPDILLTVSNESVNRNYRIFLYGGMPGAPEKITEYLRKHNPETQIVGGYSPPFRALTEQEDAEVCQMILDSGANMLAVGLGSPKQDVWIEEHRAKLPGVVMIALGGAFDFYSGRIKQAPRAFQRSGFEWLYRLFQDPRRLWKRYTIYNVIFIGAFMLECIGLLRLGSKSPIMEREGKISSD
jgi:N-acetylglucosaminyldiphosphoundecaprenol N-acetyl-beta-D-mannosaminyltransferase